MPKLPDSDELFLRFFDRWYDDQLRTLKGFSTTRPDVLQSDSYKGANPDDISPLDDAGRKESADRIHTMTTAALSDMPNYLKVVAPMDINWVTAFDSYYDSHRIIELLDRSEPEDFSNDYLIICCEFGSLLGNVLLQNMPTLQWVYSWPYWESSLLHTPSGSIIPPYHWAIKKMSSYGVDDGFTEKIEVCVQMLLDRQAES